MPRSALQFFAPISLDHFGPTTLSCRLSCWLVHCAQARLKATFTAAAVTQKAVDWLDAKSHPDLRKKFDLPNHCDGRTRTVRHRPMEHDAYSGTTAYIRENLNLHVRTGRYSIGLVQELAEIVERRSGNVFAIFDEIAFLEGTSGVRPSLTKPHAMFERPPLIGLWHKHYHQASFLAQNILNHWRANDFTAYAVKTVSKTTVPQDKLLGALVHEFVMGGYRERSRSRRLTGQWIVYVRRPEVNTYLTLGTHGDDAAIHERVFACASEFPDLELGGSTEPAS